MTAPAIPLCPTPDTHPTTCPRPRRSAETYYGHPIATTPDISTYRAGLHMTQPDVSQPDIKCTVETCPARITDRAPAADWTCDTIGRPFCPAHPVATACRICGRDKGSNRILCRPCATGEEPAPDDPGQSRTTLDNPAASGDAADNPGVTCDCTGSSAGLNACVACPTPWPDIPGATRVKRTATAPRSVADGVRAAAQVAVDSVAKALGATREEFALTGQVQPSGPNLEFEAENASQVEDGELTAEEARDLADQLGLDLYRAQDALAFVEECCVIADREGQPVTTARVRQWLQGAKCGRQILAGAVATLRNAPDLRGQLTAALEGCRTLIPEAQADAILAVVETDLSERAQVAIRALERQVVVRDQQLGEVRAELATARATTRRLNYRAQNTEHVAAVFKRAVGDWEWTDKGTYVPLRTLTAIAKAAGLEFDSARLENHIERVRRLEAEVAAVREYVQTSDDDGIRTREQVLQILGPGGEVGP